MGNIDKLIRDVNKFADQKIKEAKGDIKDFKKIILDYANKEACTLKNWHIGAWALITFMFVFSASI